jgi:predicted Zn-dependent protease
MLLQGTLGAVALGTSDSTVVGAAQLGSNLITQKYGRDAEREADLYGTRFMAAAGYDPQAAVALQETFVRLSQGGRQDFVSGLFSSHPPSVERVETNRALVASLRREGYTGGEVGRASFEVAMAHLRGARAAYEAYDAALKALAEGHEQAAAEKLSLALEIEPADAMLHGFRGDIRYLQNRYADAMINYDRAISLDAEFYRYYLMRGLARVDLDGRSGMPEARADLERSLKLLQTAVAHLALGKIAEARGDDENAYAHYEEAGSAQTEVGREARERARVLLERRRSYGARS